MSARSRKKRKLKAEINVVPYIDVMLVLLIIFMVTAPLLNLGVDIELPQSNAKPVETQKDPIVVEVSSDGRYFLTLQKASSEELEAETLVAKVSAFVRQNPDVQVLIAGDTRTDYGTVYQGMVLLQEAGVSRVGLMSKPAED
ncbi:MAG: Biopolymer transport protein ExbD [Alphaproteobacteria bacterium ADurb.BinA280]|jgi:biopolymer transport protein TolR|nr:MAG: Biopolymer transport protein ExbD [Alphaproteobacteria bacterium ADurb.BinA280]